MLAFKSLAQSIDKFFDKFHLTFIPHFVRYGFAAFFLLAPCLGFCVFLCFGEIEYDGKAGDGKKGAKIIKEIKDKKNNGNEAKSK